MKKILVAGSLFIIALLWKTCFATNGLLFNVASLGKTVTIAATVANHIYTNAGIKINTPGYSISSGCTPNPNGYCLFSTSNITPASLAIAGSTGTMSATVCLSALTPTACQNYTVTISAKTAYVANAGNNTVSICPVKADATLGTCTTSGGNGTFNTPLAIALNPTNTIAYIANFGSNTLSICPINEDGSFGTCNTFSNTGFTGLTGVAINSAGTYLYASNENFVPPLGTVFVCPINSTGSLGTCESMLGTGGDVTFEYTQFVGLQETSGTTYLYTTANAFGTLVAICPVDNSTGLIMTCATSTGYPVPGFSAPQGISFNAAGTYAYVGNSGTSAGVTNYISICPAKSDGLLGSNECATSLGPDSQGNPTFNFSADEEIGLFMSDTSNYGYIPNDGANTVSICVIDPNNGSISSCTTTTGNGTFNVPSAVVIKT